MGPVGDAVDRYLASLTLDARGAALAAQALNLAAKLDGDAGMATAAVSKELRATLDALTPSEEDDDDLVARLQAPVGDPKV